MGDVVFTENIEICMESLKEKVGIHTSESIDTNLSHLLPSYQSRTTVKFIRDYS